MAEESKRVRLTVPRPDAAALLAEVVTRGRAVSANAQSVRDEPTFAEWESEATRWRKFAIAALQRISDGDALEKELARSSQGTRIGFLGGPPPTLADRLQRRQEAQRREMDMLQSVVERLPLFDAPHSTPEPEGSSSVGRDIFVVHGRQKESAAVVARFIERLGLRAIILDEQPNRGKTLIEKFETNVRTVGFAVVLMLADDWGRGPDRSDWPSKPNRARQNVVLELGYFVGRLGRDRVAALMGRGVEKPSDIHGLAYLPFDDDWQMHLLREMKAVFPDIDANQAFA